MPEATWWVTYHDDYPGENGLVHVYFANADCGDQKYRFMDIPSSPPHEAAGCLIDHEARIADVVIPDSVKLPVAQQHWRNERTII